MGWNSRESLEPGASSLRRWFRIHRMMKWTLALLIVASLGCLSAASAQSGPANATGLKGAVQNLNSIVFTNVAEAAEKMPEEHYSFKPTPEVRSFGELVGHIANASYFFCGQAKGEMQKQPNFEQVKAKAELVKALRTALAYCDSVASAMTEASLMETIKYGSPTNATNGPRAGALFFNVSHTNEHYGNIVTYMRLKGIVPPSTERAQQPTQGR